MVSASAAKSSAPPRAPPPRRLLGRRCASGARGCGWPTRGPPEKTRRSGSPRLPRPLKQRLSYFCGLNPWKNKKSFYLAVGQNCFLCLLFFFGLFCFVWVLFLFFLFFCFFFFSWFWFGMFCCLNNVSTWASKTFKRKVELFLFKSLRSFQALKTMVFWKPRGSIWQWVNAYRVPKKTPVW